MSKYLLYNLTQELYVVDRRIRRIRSRYVRRE